MPRSKLAYSLHWLWLRRIDTDQWTTTFGDCKRCKHRGATRLRDTRRKLMLTREENDLLCCVEATLPMGQMMRRCWTPVC